MSKGYCQLEPEEIGVYIFWIVVIDFVLLVLSCEAFVEGDLDVFVVGKVVEIVVKISKD